MSHPGAARRVLRRGLVVLALSAAATALAGCSPVAPLHHEDVLDTLGIPSLDRVALTPVYSTGFEHDTDFAGFYVTPQSPYTRHDVRSGVGHSGGRAHVAWLTGAIGAEPVDGPNHRGYPTIQLQKRGTTCTTPCVVQAWVRIDDFTLRPGDWLSLATFSTDSSDRWTPVVTVNIGSEGWLSLFHVPTQGLGVRQFQRTDLPFPRGQWVRITTWLDLGEDGAVAVWQDGVLVSAARFRGGDGSLDQMHFGLYAAPSVVTGTVMNDDITVYSARPR
jgi:hypothetical protein